MEYVTLRSKCQFLSKPQLHFISIHCGRMNTWPCVNGTCAGGKEKIDQYRVRDPMKFISTTKVCLIYTSIKTRLNKKLGKNNNKSKNK